MLSWKQGDAGKSQNGNLTSPRLTFLSDEHCSSLRLSNCFVMHACICDRHNRDVVVHFFLFQLGCVWKTRFYLWWDVMVMWSLFLCPSSMLARTQIKWLVHFNIMCLCVFPLFNLGIFRKLKCFMFDVICILSSRQIDPLMIQDTRLSFIPIFGVFLCLPSNGQRGKWIDYIELVDLCIYNYTHLEWDRL